MKQRLAIFLLTVIVALSAQAQAQREYIILVGGPSLHEWEQYKAQPHDHWWANFVHAARLRTEQLRAQLGPDAPITWLVYKQGYLDRAKQERKLGRDAAGGKRGGQRVAAGRPPVGVSDESRV